MSETSLGEPIAGHQPAAPVESSETESDSWVYFIDPAYDPDDDVPPQAVIGWWPVDANGQLGPFSGNPDYRPTPAVMDMAPPADAVEAALQLAVTGHGPQADVVTALGEALLYLPVDERGGVVDRRDEDGTDFVAMYTDPSKAAPTEAPLRTMDIYTVLSILPVDASVVINPGDRAAAGFVCEELLMALSATAEADESSAS
jgi:SseB protein N-terminal domain